MNLIKWLFNSKIKTFIVIILFLAVGFFVYKNINSQKSQVSYQTATAEKGTLISSITASGNITTANNVSITIQASGVVKEVLVKNGDSVTQGQTIAILTLDQASQQKQASAYASYLSAKNSVDNAINKLNSLQAAAFKANQTFINGSVARGLATNDPTYIQENALWLQAEADYINQKDAIAQAQVSLGASALSLSQVSSTITAPVSGIVRGLTITPGAIVTTTSNSSSSTSTSQVLGSVYQEGPIQAQVNISEIDSVSVSEGQKATLTLDAFPNLTFTGKVVSINTNGVVSSNVTTYPAVISFDSGNDHIYPNMGVSAKIITKVSDNILLVPNGAVTSLNGESSVKIMKNNTPTSVTVEIGFSNDTETEITSGLNEGDIVITGSTTAATRSSGSSSSIFGARTFGGPGR